tara:strand:- start:7371 stop:7841 length:471 start_codon:yes stop_codon:yes gene_type:complete
MKIISHRANSNGPNSIGENTPDQIETMISKGFDVEIDIRYYNDNQKLYLGHDEPHSPVDLSWLEKYQDSLWIHCKNIAALYWFSCNNDNKFNYFWHQNDDYTLTSKNYIWTYPEKEQTPSSVVVVFGKPNNGKFASDWGKEPFDCYGICTDYPNLY